MQFLLEPRSENPRRAATTSNSFLPLNVDRVRILSGVIILQRKCSTPKMRTYEHECPFCGERKTRRRLEAHIDAMHPESPLPRASSCVFEGPKIKRLTTSIDKEAEVALVREQKPALFIEGTQVTKGNRTTRMFRCRLCPRKLYQRRAHVDTHVWSKHFRLKPFRCARCTGEFGQKSHLKRHLSDCHAKIKTHACCFCGSFFAQKSNLEAHILRHHSDDLKPDLDQRVSVFSRI